MSTDKYMGMDGEGRLFCWFLWIYHPPDAEADSGSTHTCCQERAPVCDASLDTHVCTDRSNRSLNYLMFCQHLPRVPGMMFSFFSSSSITCPVSFSLCHISARTHTHRDSYFNHFWSHYIDLHQFFIDLTAAYSSSKIKRSQVSKILGYWSNTPAVTSVS